MRARMLVRQFVFSSAFLMAWHVLGAKAGGAAPSPPETKTRIAIVGLDHDHVWGLLKYLEAEPNAELVAIAEPQPALVKEAKSRVPDSVKFYSAYVPMLDEVKPDAVIVTTSNDRHLEILRECAKRHIHYSVEKPMATNAADAREMEKLARQAGIKLMVNYWNAWVAPSHELFHRVKDGQVGAVQKIIVQYGHAGPKEIGVSEYFADWLYDPVKNGGGAIMDFGCYGAEWALWLKGRPKGVQAIAQKLKVSQHNKVDDDATILLEYPDATVIVEASWNWPHSMGQVQVFGPKGSLLATRNTLFYRSAEDRGKSGLEGEPVSLNALQGAMGNPVAYFVDCIRHDKTIEEPLSAQLNVQVLEILDAARESVHTGRAQELR
ncbi:MAG TPA: Gfo/Idh/MocA family oxidoreductase [Candidatus Polarisedimenticolia bacterium]|nr:Gfo/Idh/MocA family oxidoreductase [Candidatus Polarisedimenticolia bacterium]